MAIETPTLNRLHGREQILGPGGTPSVRFMAIWQEKAEKIEAAFRALSDQNDIQDGLIEAILEVQAEQAAQLALILDAQATADAVTLANDISASWIVPDSVVTATDAGSDATITIDDFTRFYDIAPSVAVTGGTLTGLAYGTTYAVYYDDATQADTTPTFVATTQLATARHNYATGRHYLDTVTTPASGGGPSSGGGYTPPGGGSSGTSIP